MTLPAGSRKGLLALLAIYAVYLAVFIARTSFIAGGDRFFSLVDDEMISLRYASNLAHGHGLVWNPGGDRVEGYSNFLWVLYLSVLSWLPVAASKVSLLVQISSAFVLLATAVVVARLAEAIFDGSRFIVLAGTAMTAFYYPLNKWALEGGETGVLTLLVTASALIATRSMARHVVNPWVYVLLGLGTLVRLDAIVPALAITAVLIAVDRPHRRQHAMIGLAILGGVVAAQTAFRWSYYGDVVPNTYYLKLTGFPPLLRIGRGAMVFIDFVRSFNPFILLLAAVGVARRPARGTALLVTVTLVQCGYSIYVGGDSWEWQGGSNRFVSLAMPMFLLLVASGLGQFVEWLGEMLRPLPRSRVFRAVLPAALVLVAVASLNATGGTDSPGVVLLLKDSPRVEENRQKVELALTIRRITNDHARVAVVEAGVGPFVMDRVAIDLLGKNDRRIAREAMHGPPPGLSLRDRLRFFHPGHMKWDYDYSIGQLQPDVIAQRWFELDEGGPFLTGYRRVVVSGSVLYVREHSANIVWSVLADSGPAGRD